MIKLEAQVSSQNFSELSNDLFKLNAQRLIVSDFEKNRSVSISYHEASEHPFIFCAYRLRVNCHFDDVDSGRSLKKLIKNVMKGLHGDAHLVIRHTPKQQYVH